jgi:hypothetical protein
MLAASGTFIDETSDKLWGKQVVEKRSRSTAERLEQLALL